MCLCLKPSHQHHITSYMNFYSSSLACRSSKSRRHPRSLFSWPLFILFVKSFFLTMGSPYNQIILPTVSLLIWRTHSVWIYIVNQKSKFNVPPKIRFSRVQNLYRKLFMFLVLLLAFWYRMKIPLLNPNFLSKLTAFLNVERCTFCLNNEWIYRCV